MTTAEAHRDSDGGGGHWRADPTGRHAERYFVGETATDVVRDEGLENLDRLGPIATRPADAVSSAQAAFESPAPAASPSQTPPPRRRRALVALMVIGALIMVGAAGAIAVVVVNRNKANAQRRDYLEALSAKGVRNQFPNDAAAVANAERVCKNLADGARAQGYERDAIGVKSYCQTFYSRFRVVPTPEEQRAAYLRALEKEGFGGKFPSDENAVAHAKKVCTDLENGGAQQGMPEDKVAVQVYCGRFLAGFKVLRTITVKGDFTLIDSDPGIYYPAIVSYGGSCEGSNGYSDIEPGTTVTVKNGSGKVLAQTSLEDGYGTDRLCILPFEFEVTEGEDSYVLEVSHRGALTYTFTELDTDGAHPSLGD